ncbi:zinc finger protein 653 isoform X1 [Stegostoma tigrinum]|uniref:zinc finger protein 653 isoform X1 n=1 Tax=Stegostoma tigrinum TaxID=3053191 RepID=UPI002870A03D|nr:zinc finger protein 653 isoform X1 [Stegostoma tigrinum]
MAAAAAAAGNQSGTSVRCHRAGPGPGGLERRQQQQQGEEEEGGEEAEEEEEEERCRRRRRRRRRRSSSSRGGHEPETQGPAALGLAAPCTVKQELDDGRPEEEDQEEEEVEEEDGDDVVKVEVQQSESEEAGRAAGSVYPAAQDQSGASGREQQQRRILIIDEQRQRVEEAVLCQEVEWDRTDRQVGGLVWQRTEAWSQDADEPGKVLVSVAGVRGQEQHPLTTLQGPARDRPGSSPAQRRRKSEYPRRRSCISFTFGGAELSTGRTEEGEEPVEIRDLQRFSTTHRENGEGPMCRLDLRTCSEALGELVGWAHSHCRGCPHLPSLRYLPASGTAPAVTTWACRAGHTYRWRAAGHHPRRRRHQRHHRQVMEATGSPVPVMTSDSQEEAEGGPSQDLETERGLDSEEAEGQSDGGPETHSVASLRIVECELEEQAAGSRGPRPGWKVIPCKDEHSDEEVPNEGLDPIEPMPDLPVLKTAPVVLMKTKLSRGRWRAKSTCEEPESDPTSEPQWESHYWEKATPSAYTVPEIHTHMVNSPELSRERPADTQPDAETETMQLICESVPDPDQKDESISLAGLAAAAGLPNSIREPELENSEEEEPELVETDDDIPFHDDPKDEMYEPSPHRERGKPRRKPRKEKEKLETVEQVEPPKRRPRRPKEDRGPRPPKKRKKPPIQYVRCEMEGCGTILANPRYLQHHMRYQHMLKKKYVCPHPSCGRLFRLQKQLLRHTKHHSDQRDYICEYCARAFKSSHNLAVHRMIHTGEKPLQCEICGFTCRQKASLNWHMKKHDADANYQFSCNMCGKKFEKKDSVVAHKSKSHPELVIAEALAESAECTVLDPCNAP